MIDTSQKILKLKVAVSQVRHFPFDIVYIVDKELKALLPRLFPYSLVLPFGEELVEWFRYVDVDQWCTITMSRKRPEPLVGPIPIDHIIDEETMRRSFMVVPVLPRVHEKTRNKRRKDRSPAYLIANQHRAGQHVSRTGITRCIEKSAKHAPFFSFFNDATTMFTPRGPQRPICVMCPRHLEHVQGRCSLGEQKCYESLVIRPQREESREQLQED